MSLISSVLNSTGSTSTGSSTSSASTSSMDQDTFLQILCAQLQYQDPTKGVDSTEYVSQLAQFSALEQMSNLNDKMESLLAAQNLIYGSSLIGKEVAVENSSGETVTGTVDGFYVEDGEVFLSVGETYYSIDDVIAVAGEEYSES